jgi:large subunit ribosomal protein L19
MKNRFLQLLETAQKKSDVPDFLVGDTIDVHQKLLDGQKERTQVFSGTVISRAGEGSNEMVTVRRLVQGEGVERIFPIHSPRVAKIEVIKAGKVRRAKLFYIRDRVGKATKIKDDVKRQVKIDAAIKASELAATKAAQDAAKAQQESGGVSKRSVKKAAKKEAEKKDKK